MRLAITMIVVTFGLAELGHASPFTPLHWQQLVERHANSTFVGQRKHLTWVRDQNRNFIDDEIEARFRPGDQVDLIVDLNRCLTPEQIEQVLSPFGHVSYVGKLLTIVLLDRVPFTKLPALAARPEVAMIEWRQPMHPDIDIASRAVEAHKSATFPNVTAEDGNLDGTGVVIAFIGTGISSATFSQLAGRYLAGFDASNPADPGDGTSDPPDTGRHESVMAVLALGDAATGQTCRNPGAGSIPNCAGIAPGAKYVNVRQCDANGCNFYVQAVDWVGINAQKFKIRIVNMSFTSCGDDDGTSAQAQQANYLAGIGLLVIASQPGTPGACTPALTPGTQIVKAPGSGSFVLTVNASDDKGTVTRTDDTIFSNFTVGPRKDFASNPTLLALKPDLTAPGLNLDIFQSGTTHITGIGGTSPATAIVSGVAALLLQKFPQMTPDSLKLLLTSAADNSHNVAFSTTTGVWDKALGWGLVNAGSALQAAAAQGTDMMFPNCNSGGTIGQPCPLANGAPAWDNELDISTTTPPQVGVANNVIVRIKNNGANAAIVQVNFGIYSFATGNNQFFHIGTQQVTVQPGQTTNVSQAWTPVDSNHQCAQVSISYGMDSDYTNNMTQRNLQVAPSVYRVRVENPFFVPAHFDVQAKSMRAGWACRADTLAFDLDPFRDCPRNVQINFAAPPGTPPGQNAKCQVAIYATPRGGERRLVGGVAVQTYVPRPCVIYGEVVDPTGKVVVGATISFSPAEPRKDLTRSSATTNADGIFWLRVTPDVLQDLRVEKAGVGEGALRLRPRCGLSLPRLVLNKNTVTLDYIPPPIELTHEHKSD